MPRYLVNGTIQLHVMVHNPNLGHDVPYTASFNMSEDFTSPDPIMDNVKSDLLQNLILALKNAFNDAIDEAVAEWPNIEGESLDQIGTVELVLDGGSGSIQIA